MSTQTEEHVAEFNDPSHRPLKKIHPIRFTEGQWSSLAEAAKEEGVSTPELIRRLIEVYLHERKIGFTDVRRRVEAIERLLADAPWTPQPDTDPTPPQPLDPPELGEVNV